MVFVPSESQFKNDRRYGKVNELLAKMPPSTNPFDFVMQYVPEQYFPPISDSSLRALRIFFVFHLVICASSAVILLMPFFRGKRNCHWLLKKLYITDSECHKVYPRPLYLLNSGMIMAFCQFIGSISTEFYIGMLYRTHRDPQYRLKAQVTTCLGITFTCEFFAYWIMAWSALYTRLYSETSYAAKLKSGNKYVLSPLMYNFIFISFPSITVILQAVFVYLMEASIKIQSRRWFELVDEMHPASGLWEKLRLDSNDKNVHDNLTREFMSKIERLEELGTVVISGSKTVVLRLRLLFGFWTPVMLITALVFIYSLGSLLFAIQQSTKKKSPCFSSESSVIGITCHNQREGQSDDNLALKNAEAFDEKDERQLIMKRRCYNLAFRGGVMVLSIISTIVACSISSIKAYEVITSPSLRSSISWAVLISGTIATLPITFQCWRIYRDEEVRLLSSQKNLKNIENPTNCNESISSNRSTLRISMPLSQILSPTFVNGYYLEDSTLRETDPSSLNVKDCGT